MRNRSTEVPLHHLEALAARHHVLIDVAPPEGGWSRISIAGGCRFHAWTPAAISEPCS